MPVVAADRLRAQRGLLWVLMITSAENLGWEGDVAVTDLAVAGLPAPALVLMAKIATIDAHEADRLGFLPSDLIDQRPVARSVGSAWRERERRVRPIPAREYRTRRAFL